MIQSVQRALRLLTLVASDGAGLGVRELSRRSGLTVPTTQNLLKTLTASGFLSFDEREKNYRIGLAALSVAECADPVVSARVVGHPYVARLHADFGVTVAFLILWRGTVLVADWMDTRDGMRVAPSHRVVRQPFHLATGRVLLAWNPELSASEEDYGVVLGTVRETGIAVTEDYEGSGVYAVAAPIVDVCGHVSASIGCSMPISRLSANGRSELADTLLGIAREMSDALRNGTA